MYKRMLPAFHYPVAVYYCVWIIPYPRRYVKLK